MQEKIVTLKGYNRIETAKLDQLILQEQKIPSAINDSPIGQILPMLQEVGEIVELKVFEQDVEKALKILTDYHKEED